MLILEVKRGKISWHKLCVSGRDASINIYIILLLLEYDFLSIFGCKSS